MRAKDFVHWLCVAAWFDFQFRVASGADILVHPKVTSGLRGANDQRELFTGIGAITQARIIDGTAVTEDRYPYFSLMYGRNMCGK